MFVPRKVRKRTPAAIEHRASISEPNHSALAVNNADDATREEERIDRLVQLVFDTLSPISLVRQQQTCTYTRDFVDYLTKQGHTHVARVLELPLLRTRCKNVALLSSVLQRLTDLPWISHDPVNCRVTFAPTYIEAIAHPLRTLLEADRIVYVESLPSRSKTQLEAIAHIQQVLADEHEYMALGLYEPTRSGYPPGTYEQPARWISGRAFFVLSHASAVQKLTTDHPWDLAHAGAAPRRTLRCLSLPQWLQLKEEYLALKRPLPAKRKAEPAEPALDAAQQPWYRGTILTKLLSNQSVGNAGSVPKKLKAALEKRVPESISYVHIQPACQDDQNGKEDLIVVRTAHPRLAQQLLTTQSEAHGLTRMDEKAEDAYWHALSLKTRNQAQKRAIALDSKNSSSSSDTAPPTSSKAISS